MTDLTFKNKVAGMTLGTYIHGIFDNSVFRKFILELLRKRNNMKTTDIDNPVPLYETFKEEQYNRLADVFRENMGMELFYKILKNGL